MIKFLQHLLLLITCLASFAHGNVVKVRPVEGVPAQIALYKAIKSNQHATQLEIRLSPGDFYFSEPLRLDSSIIPKKLTDLSITVEKVGTVKFLGSALQTAEFRKESKNIVAATLSLSGVRNLYINDTLAPLAKSKLLTVEDSERKIKRTENGFVLLDSVSTMPRSAKAWKGAELWGLDQWRLFGGKVLGVSGDTLLLNSSDLLYWSRQWQSGAYFREVSWICNHRSLLDQHGEWFYDVDTRQLSIFLSDEAPLPQTVSVGLVSTLISIQGFRSMPKITISGIEFSQTGWSPPEEGFVTHQVKHVKNGSAEYLPAVVEAYRVNNLNLQNCSFHDIGADAVHLLRGTTFSSIHANTFNRIGGSAIVLGESGDNPSEISRLNSEELFTYSNVIDSNSISRVGEIYSGSVAIFLAWGHSNLISANTITNTPYSGIAMGWGWGAKNYSRLNVIKSNRIYNVCKLLPDGAAVYLMGWQGDSGSGPQVLDNYIERWHGYAGIYLDNGLENGLVKGNTVVHGTSGRWIHVQPLHPPAINNAIMDNDTVP